MAHGPDPDDRIEGEAPVRVLTPVSPGRFVFASPHSGDRYPDDMGAAASLPPASLRSAEDARVDALIAPGLARGATLVIGRIGRAYVDVNRDPADLDPQLIADAPAGGGARSAAGYGVVPRLSGDGRPLYDRRLTLEEARARIAGVHAAYHAALFERMQAARAAHGTAVLIDWHSMPARAVGGARGVDVVLGDRHGTACDPALTRRVRGLFEAMGWRVALNHPYAGGWSTQVWGRPHDGFHALQIELSRALYFDEATLAPGAGWNRCRKGIERVIAGLLAQA
jgi:N-formylglutamate amidohydrolase